VPPWVKILVDHGALRRALSDECLSLLVSRERETTCPAARSVVESGVTGGARVACSDRAEPRHLRGSP
jgi:hypothetical protein